VRIKEDDMKRKGSQAALAGITFRELVKDCAGEPQLVESFNRAYGADLRVPIEAIVDDRWPSLVPGDDDEFLIGCFVVFIHENIWMRLKRARVTASASRRVRSRDARQ
jgi:hypothetical protein